MHSVISVAKKLRIYVTLWLVLLRGWGAVVGVLDWRYHGGFDAGGARVGDDRARWMCLYGKDLSPLNSACDEN